MVRRQRELLLPSAEVREYRAWSAERVRARRTLYKRALEPGLFSILTAVWDESPVPYLRELARSIFEQDPARTCEWVVIDNGCRRASVLACLEWLCASGRVRVVRLEENAGITRGLRACLEHARNRYVMAVDGDDLLYPDALRVVTSAVVDAEYPPLLYTDEDKVLGARVYQPYFKPDWDPVLLLNSAYIAHLGLVERARALELDAYGDRGTEGSPDWDLFVRFLAAGERGVHVPEVVYSWRVHGRSTADDTATKPYIADSQRKVLERYLQARGLAGQMRVEPSPLFTGGAHFRIVRKGGPARAFVITTPEPGAHPSVLLARVQEAAAEDGHLAVLDGGLEIDGSEWQSEALGIFELHPETVMVGGTIASRAGVIWQAGSVFGFNGVCGCPYAGWPVAEPGCFGALWKQRSVSAVAAQFAVIRARFLLDLMASLPADASLAFLGAWAGAWAWRTGQRVVYSPFLSAVAARDWAGLVSEAERARWLERNRDLLPDTRFYSRHFSLRKPFALAGVTEPAAGIKME